MRWPWPQDARTSRTVAAPSSRPFTLHVELDDAVKQWAASEVTPASALAYPAVVPMRVALVASIVGFSVSVMGLTATTQNPPPRAATATGLIAGRVVEADSDRPVPEAIVTLTISTDERRRVMVDGQGRFVFNGLAAGRYQIEAEQFGYLRGEYGRLRPSGGALRIDLTEGQRVTDVPVLLWRLVSISGRILDEAGEPVVGVSVRALQRSVQKGQTVLTASFAGYRAVATDDRGVYRLSMLPPGDYAVAVPARVSTFPVEVMRDVFGSGVSLGISETSRLGDYKNLQIGTNVLTTTSFMPIPPARDGGPVTVYQTTFYPAATSVDAATVLPMRAGENRTGIDIRLIATSTARVSGEMIGPAGPLPLTAFRLVRAGGGPSSEDQDFEVATGITDARGQFTLLGVPAGTYVLRVRTSRPAGTAPGTQPILSAAETVTIGGADLANVVVTTRPSATITGRVEIRGTNPVAPEALTLIVEALDAGPVRMLNPRFDKDFRFRAELLPGRYLVWAVGPSDLACVSTSGGRDISDDLLDVGTDNIDDIAIACSEVSTRISGAVRDDKGQPDPRARVLVFSTDRRHWSGAGYRPRRSASVRATTAATFAVPNLPPGDYFVVAIPETASADWELPSVRDALIPSATRVSLTTGSARSIDLRTVVIK